METNIWIAVVIALIIGGLGGWMIGNSKTSNNLPSQITQTTVSSKSDALKIAMRKLWEDHITWTRIYLNSAILGAGNSNVILNRLLKNQEDIGNAVKSYYVEDAGNKLTALLKEHISGAGELLKAAKANDQAALNSANDNWYKNGEQIADFLSGANPNWPKDQMRAMMKDHLDLTKQEAVDMLGKKTEESVVDYDKIHDQILQMSDMLSDGIAKQFPDKFK